MNNKITYWLRWIMLLPGAFFAAYLANLILLEAITLLIDPDKIAFFLSFILLPFTFLFFSVYAVYIIAPAHKTKTAKAFLVILIILQIPLLFINLPDDQLVELIAPSADKVIRFVFAIAGAIIGFYMAKETIKPTPLKK